MKFTVPTEVATIAALVERAGYEIYIVGGSVRDLLASRPVHDWDFTTSARPEDIMALFPDAFFYENAFGTVSIVGEDLYRLLGTDPETQPAEKRQAVYEITTFRSEGTYSDHRRPDQVQWGKSIQDDLQRRDFTINAMAVRLQTEAHQLPQEFASAELALEGSLVDPFDGRADLHRALIRAVGNPQERFQEDALRMLRAIRLAAQLQFALDPEVLVAIQTQAHLIEHVSWERIRDEFLKILQTNQIEDALNIMATTGLLQYILPELLSARGIEQRGHHEYDVWTHLLRATQLCPTTDPIVKMAALLHDIAKPETQAPLPDQPGEYSFYNHEVIGARTARDIARRFHLSKDDVQRIFTLVRWHMFHYQPEMTDSAIRRFMRRVGLENLDDIMALREGDRLGSGSKRTSWRLEEMKQRIEEQLHQPMQVSDLAIDGHDVMETLQLQPGPQIGDILNDLFEEVLENPEKNTRDYLLAQLPKYAHLSS